MSDAATITAQPSAGIGPGRLVLIVGPSGAGKDTLIGLAKASCGNDRTIVFSRRVVTREGSASEDNEHLSPASFEAALARGGFAVHWRAHGHLYGLRRAIDDEIRGGRTVVVNVSRTVVEAMRRTYADVMVVSVTAPPDARAERLASRARSSDGEIVLRLKRVVDETAVAPDLTILNIGNVEEHAQRLIEIIRGNCG
ncbi:MAG: phosphonate metabolism protein/1,5-bisphosphokinase (PRPP-forming) PhnN [Bradyrhizobium sp.]